MLSNHFFLCYPPLLLPSILPSIRDFSSESILCIRWPKDWTFSILPMNIQDWFSLGLANLISLKSKGFSRVFFSTMIRKHQFFGAQPFFFFFPQPSLYCLLLVKKQGSIIEKLINPQRLELVVLALLLFRWVRKVIEDDCLDVFIHSLEEQTIPCPLQSSMNLRAERWWLVLIHSVLTSTFLFVCLLFVFLGHIMQHMGS